MHCRPAGTRRSPSAQHQKIASAKLKNSDTVMPAAICGGRARLSGPAPHGAGMPPPSRDGCCGLVTTARPANQCGELTLWGLEQRAGCGSGGRSMLHWAFLYCGCHASRLLFCALQKTKTQKTPNNNQSISPCVASSTHSSISTAGFCKTMRQSHSRCEGALNMCFASRRCAFCKLYEMM